MLQKRHELRESVTSSVQLEGSRKTRVRCHDVTSTHVGQRAVNDLLNEFALWGERGPRIRHLLENTKPPAVGADDVDSGGNRGQHHHRKRLCPIILRSPRGEYRGEARRAELLEKLRDSLAG